MEEDKSNQDLVIGGDGSLSDGSESNEIGVNVSKESPVIESSDSVSVDTMTAPVINQQESVNAQEDPPRVEHPMEDGPTIQGPVQAPELIESVSPDNEAIQGTTITSENNDGAEYAQNSIISQVALDSKPTEPVSINAKNNNVKLDKQPNRNNKKFAVIITIVVALVLSGIAVFVYASAQGNTKKNADTKNKIVQPSNTQTQSDIQNTEDAIKADDQNTNPTSDIVDPTNPPIEEVPSNNNGSGTNNSPSDSTTTPSSSNPVNPTSPTPSNTPR